MASVISTPDLDAQKKQAEQELRIAQGFQDRGDLTAAQRVQRAGQSLQESTTQRMQFLNRNVPDPSGPQTFKSEVDWDRGTNQTSMYEPVSVTPSGDTYIVERRGLLTDENRRGYRQEPYVKERLVLNKEGDVVTREEYDTYTTPGGRDRAYLRLRETPDKIEEKVRNREGDLLRESTTNKTTGQIISQRYDPYAEKQQQQQQQQQLQQMGLSQQDIARLSPGQQRALLDPKNAKMYTGTPVPADIQAKTSQQRVTAVRDAQGNTFQRGSGGAELPGQFIGVREVTPAEQQVKQNAMQQAEKARRVQAARQQPGIAVTQQGQFPAGQTILIQEGKKGKQTDAEVFKALGAPETKLVGQIDFGRRPNATIPDRVKGALGLNVPVRPDEVSRTSKVFETMVNVPNEASAKFAGFPGAGQYLILFEERQDFPRKTFLQREAPIVDTTVKKVQGKLNAIDQAAVDLAINEPEGRGKPIRRIRELGGIIESVGKPIADFGQDLEAKNPMPKNVEANGLKDALQQDAQRIKSRTGTAAAFVGGFLEEEGRTLQRSPVTGGAGEAVLIGVGVGGLSKGAKLLKASRYAQEAGTAARVLRGTAATVEAVEVAGSVALGGAFVYQTGKELIKAENSRAAGGVTARAANEVVGFGLGFKAGAKAITFVDATAGRAASAVEIAKLNRKFRNQIIVRDMATEIARVSRDLSLDVQVRPIEANVRVSRSQERGGLKLTETTEQQKLGEPRLVRGEDLANAADTFQVIRMQRTRELTLQENIGPVDAVEAKGLPQRGGIGVLRETKTGQLGEVITAAEAARKPKLQDLSVIEARKSDLKQGLRRETEQVTVEFFQPIELSTETGLTVKAGRKAGKNSPKQVGYTPPAIETAAKQPVAIEKVVRFTEEPGPTVRLKELSLREGGTLSIPEELQVFRRGRAQLAINAKTGEFKLVEFTEFRRFQRGTKGIPGRAILSKGRLPVEEGAGPMVLEKVVRRKTPDKGTSSQVRLGSDEVEVSSGNQVLLKKRVFRQQAKQEAVRVSKQEEVKVEQASGSLAQQRAKERFQETVAEAKSLRKTLAEKNRFAAVGLAALAGRKAARLARGVPRLDSAQSTTTRVQTILQIGQAQTAKQAQDALQDAKLRELQDVRLDQSSRQESKLSQLTENKLRDRIREKAGLRAELKEKPKVPSSFGMKGSKRGVKGYRLLIKRGGRFAEVKAGVLTQARGLELGAQLTDTSAAQTFKLVATDEAVTDERNPTSLQLDRELRKFGKTKQGTFREKQSALIDSGGELSQITFKGIAASARQRRKF